ncbi:response regulator [Sphingobium sp. GW456-12-10-14-TSB1]|uniref:response regulator transcription factor n=1 Tax=Sphingobium sp. GW456-12-10-14-TSB1 TaxID=1987165 RepID=UPI000A3BBE83|nr:response regulator [Sphingobium sp. GW456-12-10-14-TSB1]OUC54481.1 response regulator [Sphingobium sp. GW456-12-10-14-TSB1]
MSSRRSSSNREYRILLSDDDPAVRRALHLLLRSHGYQVCGYTTGRALLADPEALDANCVILDYRMPDIDGFAMLEQLRAQGWNGTAIMISGFHDNRLARRAHEAGFDHVIPKPLIGRAVLDAVGRHAQSGFQ